jgi:hypothetical protein
MKFLLLSASVLVFLGFCWLLGLHARSDSNGRPLTWWHLAVTAVLCAVSVGLTAYMVR